MSTLGQAIPRSRVVLVGRTGLEGDLRREAAIELARARTPMDAVGEFAEISEPNDSRASAVIVQSGLLDSSHAESFIGALRKIDPRVRVVSLGDANGSAELFDAVLPERATAASLRGVLQSDAPSYQADAPEPTARYAQPAPPSAVQPVELVPEFPVAPRTVVSRPAPQQAPAAAPAPVRSAPIAAAASIPAALTSLLSGADPVEAALKELSARVGVPVEFSTGDVDSFAEAAASVRVTWGGRALGWLRAPGADRALLEAASASFGGWVLLAAQQDQLRRAAFTDELTGAFNRRYFNRFLAAAMDHARAKRHTVTLLVFDIDNFKTYNDKYSHSAGDDILVETVRLLNSVIRPSDRVCRVGGDEFAVVFHDPEGPRNPSAAIAPQTIKQIAARFQKQICEHRFPKLLDEAAGTLTISGGLATFPWDGATPEELLGRADELAMQSKRQGKNHIMFGPGAEKVCSTGIE